MKKQVLGFGTIFQFQNNIPGQESPIGELSSWSRTYSKEKGEYQDTNVPGYGLVTFSSKDTATEVDVELDHVEVVQVIEVIRQLVLYASSAVPPIDPNDFRDSIQAQMYASIESLVFGEMNDLGAVALPSWISWTSKTDSKSDFHIWLSDQAFQDQYPNYFINVSAPLKPVVDLLGNWQTNVDKMQQRPLSVILSEAQDDKNQKPETYVRTLEIDYVNRNNVSQKYKVNFVMMIYGVAGDDLDAIKDAIIAYLVKESGRPETDWEPVFPDLFKRTEFILWPRWDLPSIPNMSQRSGLYSTIVGLQESLDFCTANTDFYLQSWIQRNSYSIPIPYKTLSLAVVNGENNADGMKDFKALYPDYIPVDTTSPDFERMQALTKNWVLFVNRMAMAAETATNISQLPRGFRRTKRNNKLFVSGVYNKATYLMAARSNPLYGLTS